MTRQVGRVLTRQLHMAAHQPTIHPLNCTTSTNDTNTSHLCTRWQPRMPMIIRHDSQLCCHDQCTAHHTAPLPARHQWPVHLALQRRQQQLVSRVERQMSQLSVCRMLSLHIHTVSCSHSASEHRSARCSTRRMKIYLATKQPSTRLGSEDLPVLQLATALRCCASVPRYMTVASAG